MTVVVVVVVADYDGADERSFDYKCGMMGSDE